MFRSSVHNDIFDDIRFLAQPMSPSAQVQRKRIKFGQKVLVIALGWVALLLVLTAIFNDPMAISISWDQAT